MPRPPAGFPEPIQWLETSLEGLTYPWRCISMSHFVVSDKFHYIPGFDVKWLSLPPHPRTGIHPSSAPQQFTPLSALYCVQSVLRPPPFRSSSCCHLIHIHMPCITPPKCFDVMGGIRIILLNKYSVLSATQKQVVKQTGNQPKKCKFYPKACTR